MKRFNKSKALQKLNNKSNNRTKKYFIIISIVILVVAIIYFSFAKFESNQTYSLMDGIIAQPLKGIAKQLVNKKTEGSLDLQYDGIQYLGEYGTSDNNLRYVGSAPDNYVYFNCITTDETDLNDVTCERWRIIGMFNNVEDANGKKVSRVKIMRDQSLGVFAWDASDESINDGSGLNIWGESTYKDGTIYNGSKLMQELNTDYLGNVTIGVDGKWYGSSGKLISKPYSTINIDSQKMIDTVKWYTGTTLQPLNTLNNFYTGERNNSNVIEDEYNKYNIKNQTSWIGKIALIYPSEYAYTSSYVGTTVNTECMKEKLLNYYEISDCYQNSWIYKKDYREYTITALFMKNVYDEIYTIESGEVVDYPAIDGYNVRPSLYLKDNVEIIGGDGSSTNPYKLAIK